MQFHNVTLNDIELFRKYTENDERSYYNFTTNFIWSFDGLVKICEHKENLLIMWTFENDVDILYPIGNPDTRAQVIDDCMAYFYENSITPHFSSMSANDVLEIKRLFPGKFVFDYRPDYSDYVYSAQNLIKLTGKKLHSKRNHLNAFFRNNSFYYKTVEPEDIPACKKIFDKWFESKNENEYFITESKTATYRLLDNYEALGLTGGIIYANDSPVAFSFGEQISKRMALIHIEYADPDIPGSFTAINQQFAEHSWADVQYINREEDMGNEGLKKAKLSYLPEYMQDVYVATVK